MKYSRDAMESDSIQDELLAKEMIANERRAIETVATEIVALLKERAEHQMDAEEPRFLECRRILLDSSYLGSETREFLQKHRTLQRFWELTARNHKSYAERRALVDVAFEGTFARLDGLVETSPLVEIDEGALQALEMVEAERIWKRARKRINDDKDAQGSLTLSRSLLESVCKQILTAHNGTFSNNDTTANLCKRALACVLPENTAGSEHFKVFARTIGNLVEHIALYRTEESDAHGSPEVSAVQLYQATYAVNLAGSTAMFLIECYQSRELA
jgi:hypothetical protein